MGDNTIKSVVLIVDDSRINIDVLNGILHVRYDVKFALDGSNALRIATAEPHPDIILLDVMMPEMDGYQVCEKLKQDPSTAEIPVIFVTALDDLQNEVRGFEVGGVDYITKPVVPELVLARVETHLELKEAKDKLVEYSQRLEKMLENNLDI